MMNKLKKISTILCVIVAMTSLGTISYADTVKENCEEIKILTKSDMKNNEIHYLTDSLRGVSKPSVSDKWDIYFQNYLFNLDFDSNLFTNYNFTNHGGEILVEVTCNSKNPDEIEMKLYKAGSKKCLSTLKLNPSGTTTGRFYNLDKKTDYYFKFHSPNHYKVRGVFVK